VAIYFPLGGNAHSLVAGRGATSVRRRLVIAALMHDKVYIDDGEWRANSGPEAKWVARTPSSHMAEADRKFQPAAERHRIGSERIAISLRPEGASETIDVASDTSLYWRATFEPFKRELREAYPWLEFINVKLPHPDQQIADAMAQADIRDGHLADLISDSNSRGVVTEATSEAFVLGSRILAAISLDSMHQNVLKARLARGQAAQVFGHHALRLVFPTVDRMAWEDVDSARRLRGLVELRSVLAEVEETAWVVSETGEELDERIRQEYMARSEQAVAQLQPSLPGTAIAIAVGTGIGLVTGPLAPIVGIAAGAGQTVVSSLMARQSYRSSWMATSERLRAASRRDRGTPV
jgi:predicted HD phosphohydrolase